MTQKRHAPDTNAELQLEAELRRLRRDDQRVQPDWSAMQASITLAVSQLPTPQLPWWRRWSVLVPVSGALLASTAALLLWRVQASEPSAVSHAPVVAALSDAGSQTTPVTSARFDTEAVANASFAPLVLDGEDLDAASIDETALQQVFIDETQAAADAVASDDFHGSDDDMGLASAKLVPSSLQWVDNLAADDLDELDQWLDSQLVKKG